MEYFFRFEYPWLVAVFLALSIVVGIIYYFFKKPIIYRFPLVSELVASPHYKKIPFYRRYTKNILRFLTLLVLALLVGKPQWVQVDSKVRTEGIDIMLVLDVSGSMQCFDDLKDRRSRFEVAKAEATRFIEKRINDAIGLILFGKVAITRIPRTVDKMMLKETLNALELGQIDPEGTVLSIALSMAVKRLKDSQAKSKIIIMLTDGEPTPGIDIPADIPINMAKKLGIKVYTIGVGDEHGGLWHDPLFGIRPMGFKLNTGLLNAIAQQTGGQFFLAKKPDDLKKIYNYIDALEKTEYEMPIFTNYWELVLPFSVCVLILLLLELLFSTIIWFAL